MRADRLLSILLWLQSHGKMTARELAEKLEVSERTILRDMDALSVSGVPVLADRGPSGGWYLTEGYRTQLTGLREEELQSLFMALSMGIARELDRNGAFDAASLKLLASLPPTQREVADFVRRKLFIDKEGWRDAGETFPLLSIVQDAVWGERRLLIRYGRDGVASERMVNPLGLVCKSHIWYLVASYDVAEPNSQPDIRSFRISRLQDARMLEEASRQPDSFDLESFWRQSTAAFKSSLPQYPAVVRIKDSLAEELGRTRFVTILKASPAADGWITAEVRFDTLESACRILLSFGGNVQALEPAALAAEVKSQAAAALALYS